MPPFRIGSNTSPRRCPAPLQKHGEQESAAGHDFDRQPAGTSRGFVPPWGKGQHDPCGVPAPGGAGVSGSTPRGTWGHLHPHHLHAVGSRTEEKEHGAAAASSALRKAAGERRFVGLWLQARLVWQSPAKTYTSRILRVKCLLHTETTIFACQQKVGSKDNGTFKAP